MLQWQMPLLFFISGYFLAFYSPNSWEKSKFQKNEKKAWRYISFYTCVPMYVHIQDVWLLRYGVQQMGRQMNRWADCWKKWHIEVGITLKNNLCKIFTKNGSKCNDYLQLKEATVLVSQVIAKRKEDNCSTYFTTFYGTDVQNWNIAIHQSITIFYTAYKLNSFTKVCNVQGFPFL